MEAKTQLNVLLDRYFIKRDEMRGELQELRLDTTTYTPDEQKRMIQSKETEMGIETEKLLHEVEIIIKGAAARLIQTQKQEEKLQRNTAYMMERSGILEMLKLGADTLTAEQIRAAAAAYRNDPVTMAALRGALVAGGYSGQKAEAILSAVKDGQATADMLERLLVNLRAAVVTHPVYGMALERVAVGMLLDGWNDDLTRCG